MIEHFSDENFIQAAKAYQSIKAPSDLRERVLAAAETAAEEGRRDTKTSVSRTVPVPARKRRGRIYHAASLAACMAIMIAALPNWLPGEEAETGMGGPGPAAARIITELPDDVPQIASEEGQQPDMAAFTPDAEDTADVTAEDTVPAAEPRQIPQPSAAEQESASESEGEPADSDEKTPDEETEDFQEEHAPEVTSTLAASKLIPGMAASAVLENLEVRLVQAEDGTCTVELTNSGKTASVSVARNAENGQWEVMETEPN